MTQIFLEKIFRYENRENNTDERVSKIEIVEAKYVQIKLQVFDNEVNRAF